MSLRLLLTLSGGLEILAGLPALISPAPVVSLLFGVPVGQLAAVLAQFFGAGVFALGLACLKARDDVGSAADLAVSVGITSYKYAGSRGISGLQQSRAWAACCCEEPGLPKRFSACYSCPASRGRNDNRTERGSVHTASCVNQHPPVRSRQSRELVKGDML